MNDRAQAPVPSAAPSEDQRQKTVLIIGRPDSSVCEAVSEALPGWKLSYAGDSQEALARIEKNALDLVITDEASSGRDDVELLQKMRTLRPHTRVIIVTDVSTPADVIAAIRARAFSYFTRPFSPSAFAEILQIAQQSPPWDEGIEMLQGTDAWIRLSVRCDLPTANRVLQFIHEVVDLPEAEADKVATAFREMLLNAMEHGGKFDPSRRVEIGYLRAQHMIVCRIKDPGDGFSLKENLDTAANNPPDDPLRHLKHREEQGIRPGGYGVMLAKNMVDEMFYTEKGNEVLLIKYIGKDESKEPSS